MTNASSLQGPAASTNGSLLQGLLDRISATMEYLKSQLREGAQKKQFYLGLCPKHRTPPTHRVRLGLH